MLKEAKKLFPICRSITGEGIRKSFNHFKNKHKEFKTFKFKTGEKVFDWVIPKEWQINDAYLEHESGERYAEFSHNNLHVYSYSKPVDKVMSKSELLNHIHTLPSQPKAIPYATTYYSDNWGFCLDYETYSKLPEGKYKVLIDSKLFPGNLELIESKLKGKYKKEIFFSSYLCHPSMANDELSGPVLIDQLISYIKKKYPENKMSYRFVLLPETIGSIAYLSKNYKDLKKNVIAALI